jgi:hypothetical protein
LLLGYLHVQHREVQMSQEDPDEMDGTREEGSTVCPHKVKGDDGKCNQDCGYIVPKGGTCKNAANHCD